MKLLSIFVLAFCVGVLVYFALYLIVLKIAFDKSLGPKKALSRIEKKADLLKKYKIDLCWWNKYKFEDLTAISDDGWKLKGHFYNANTDKTVILVHGFGADYREMQNYAQMFLNMGYNILAVENRAHGNSEGDVVGMGWLDKDDVIVWCNIIAEKIGGKILLFGLSMGASAVCMASGEILPKNIVCIIEDCGFANAFEQIKSVFNPKNTKLRNWFLKIFYNYLIRVHDFNLKDADALKQLAKNKLPVMIIHGKEDNFVNVENAIKLAEKVPEYRRDFYLVEGAEHAMAYPINPRKYEMKVREFLKKWNM